ncbi:hypothetical protein [Bacillus andreraoultii]|uniref:hypothetical protein n=1 Tax=Bacillus andreraoultii TaxID=1499685 RepID=UPI001112096F|nr:hypothetical protein [Bacillus andreraoultii]
MVEELKNKHYYAGMFVGNYKDKFEQLVSELLLIADDEGNPPSLVDRKAIIVAATDAYIDQIGLQPDGVQIQRLANWLLYEDLTDGRPDKVKLTEYPFLTKRQLRTRYRREQANDILPQVLTEQHYLRGRRSNRCQYENQNHRGTR